METIHIKTSARCRLVDITDDVNHRLAANGWSDGILLIFTPHTTAGITINENADPDVRSDMTMFLNRLIPNLSEFKHDEGNSDSHIKSTLTGASETVIVENCRLKLGKWQGIYFCEFDGPRNREIWLKFISA